MAETFDDSLRVLHLSHTGGGGVARSIANLVADQVARGWSVSVACPRGTRLARESRRVGASHYPWTAARAPGAALPWETTSAMRILSDAGPCLVHLHSSKAGLVGRLAVRGRRPTIFQPRAWSFYAVEGQVRVAICAWERFAARWADVVVCVSDQEERDGKAAGISARWRVIRNGVDLEHFSVASAGDRERARRDLSVDADLLVVCVGRLSEQKGQDLLLEAWPRVVEKVPTAGLAFVGEGPSRSDLEARADGSVRFAGQTDDVRPWLAAADIVAVPSRWEGMAYSMLEAMASARSVVSADVAGARDALGTEAGAVIEVGNTTALANALVERLIDTDVRDSEGIAGRGRVERFHDLRRTTQSMADLYTAVTRPDG